MSLAKITIYGMYRWMADSNDDLFYNMTLPAGMDKSKLIDTIMLNGAEFESLYGDPDVIKVLIGAWSNKYYHTFERWVNALSIEYNPLENYDRIESWTDSGTRDTSATAASNSVKSEGTESNTNRSNANSVNVTNNGSTTNQVNTTDANNSSSEVTEEHTVSAYDANTYQPDNKIQTDTSSTEAGASSTNGSSTSSDTASTQSTEAESTAAATNTSGSEQRTDASSENEKHAAVHTGRLHGNIGVTTSQQMLESEWEVAKLNIYNEAADLFLTEFAVYTY